MITKYLKITSEVETEYDNVTHEDLKIEEINEYLIFKDANALKDHCKIHGWIKNDSEAFKTFLKNNKHRYTPVATIEARQGAKIKHLYFSANNKPPTYIWNHDSSQMMNNALTENYRWKQLVEGKVKIYAEIDPTSLMTKEELEKFKADKEALKLKKAKKAENNKKKKLEQAKKLVAQLEAEA